MEKGIKYPDEEQLESYNLVALEIIRAKKADKTVVLSRSKLTEITGLCKSAVGDIYDKAVILMKGIAQLHPFASGNRRTAFIAAKDFLISNNASFGIRDDPAQAAVMQGIRENHYTNDEIKRWLKYGTIREFQRRP